MKIQRKKNRGFTVAELSVSAGVMSLVAVITCNVMVTSAKLTKGAVSTSQQTSNGRVAFDQLMNDVRQADAVLSEVTLDKTYSYDSSGTLILRKKATDLVGNVMPNAYDVTIYTVTPSPNVKEYGTTVLKRITCRITNGTAAVPSFRPVAMPCVGKLNFALHRAETIDWSSGVFPLPGRVTFSAPSGTDIEIHGASLARLGLSLDQSDLVTGLVSLAKVGVSLDITGTLVNVPGSIATDKLDVLYSFNLSTADPVTKVTKTNLVDVVIQQMIPASLAKADADRIIEMKAQASLRNAQ